ncbi:hypothetical protein BVRB_4g073410 [Beta vulgaris subsp. vulgaris]|nr:hypothetical protein BVRB_4g073410 [Beta vulgaris subsp. vulgaris]
MATNSSSLCFAPVAGGHGNLDAINRVLSDLCIKGIPKVPSRVSEDTMHTIRD